MWKCASRTIKATFHKSILKCSNALSTTAPVDKNVCPFSKLAPFVVEHINRYYGSCKSSCCIFTKYKKNKGGFRWRNSFLERFENNFFDALKLSGLFVLSYYFFEQSFRKRLPQINGPLADCSKQTAAAYPKYLQFLINNIGSKSVNFVLPEVKAAKDRVVENKICTDALLENLKTKNDNLSEIEKAHQKVLGFLSNLKGTHCMELGNYGAGVEHFMKAAQYENATAIFNLGICHERGLGTSQNIKRAAELYRKAANLGHATAMYNLGVLYTRGSGELNMDVNKARKLFQDAAGLGQMDAIKALNLEKEDFVQLPEEIVVKDSKPEKKESNSIIQSICGDLLSQSAEKCKECLVRVKGESCDSLDFTEKQEMGNSILDNDSGVLDLSPHNESDVVLLV